MKCGIIQIVISVLYSVTSITSVMMFKLMLVVFTSASAWSAAHAQTNKTCRDVSEEVDELLCEADYLMFNDMVRPLVNGFHQELHLSLLGLDVMKITLEVQNGSLSGLDSMSRSDDSSLECWTAHARTMQGVFHFNTLMLSYDFVKTGFWFWEITGSLSYQIIPTLSMKITKKTDGSDDCRLETYMFSDPGEIEYSVFIDESSWKGWFARKVLYRVLTQDGANTPLLPSVLTASRSTMESYFKRIWCDHSNPYPKK